MSDNLRPDPLINKLVDCRKNFPKVREFSGFLGDSPREGYIRLYVGQLDKFYEIAKCDILHSFQTSADEESSLGGTVLFVKEDATVDFNVQTSFQAKDLQSDFLKGQLMSRYLGRTGVTGLATPTASPQIDVPTWVLCAISPIVSIIIIYSGDPNSTCCGTNIGFTCVRCPA